MYVKTCVKFLYLPLALSIGYCAGLLPCIVKNVKGTVKENSIGIGIVVTWYTYDQYTTLSLAKVLVT